MTHQWNIGDKLKHAGKPEWGLGTVTAVQGTKHQGTPCQRVTVRFARGGNKTLSTAFADLRPADADPALAKAVQPGRAALTRQSDPPASPPQPRSRAAGRDEAPPPSRFDDLDPEQARQIMTAVPDSARDPFAPLEQRLAATLALYGPDPSPADLLGWASSQSGLEDPMTVFSRHELERFHEQHIVRLDQHLAALLAEARSQRIDTAPVRAAASPHAQRALRRINAAR